jgi:hypothetical protein
VFLQVFFGSVCLAFGAILLGWVGVSAKTCFHMSIA